MKIYISGRIKDNNNYIEEFAHVEKELITQGHEVVNPVTLPHNHDKSYSSYMKEDCIALLDCDAIFMIPGWNKSRGANFERDLAIMCGIEVKESTFDIL